MSNSIPTKFEERLNRVKSRVIDSIACLKEDLIGNDLLEVIDLDKLQKKIPSYFDDFTDEHHNSKESNGLLIGVDENTTPRFFANAVFFNIIADEFNTLSKEILELGKAEHTKTVNWAKRILETENIEVKFEDLLIRAVNPAEEIDSIVEQVLEYNMGRLKKLLSKIPDDTKGEQGLIRDLIKMRIEDDKKYSNLFISLRDAKDIEIIKDVLNSESIKNNKWFCAIEFIGKQLIMLKEKEIDNESN